MTDVLAALPRLEWQGIVVPVSTRSLSFQQENIRHAFVYRDGELVESTGARNLQFSYTIPFRQDIAAGPYRNLFTETYPEFFLACRASIAGQLVDPVLGKFRAKCLSFSETVDIKRRDGLDVSVEFVQAPDPAALEDPEQIEVIHGLSSEGGALADTLSAIDFSEDTTDSAAVTAAEVAFFQEFPPEVFVDLFAQLDGFLRRVDRFGSKVSAKVDAIAFKLNKLEDSVEKLEQPDKWPIIRSSRRLRGSLERVRERALNPGKKIVGFTTKFATTITSLSSELGVTPQILMQLNPELAKSPMVAQGVAVRYLQEADASIPSV